MSAMLAGRLEVPIPKIMRTLERDSRGYPIPFLVLRDKAGKPHFTVNDHARATACRTKKLCAICGKRLAEPWFVGGSRCFLHEHGRFLDPPVHHECGLYALQVCPFLAAPRWAKRIAGATLADDMIPAGLTTYSAEYVEPALPERFGYGMANSYDFTPARPDMLWRVLDWGYVEWWRGGVRIDAPDSGDPPPEASRKPGELLRR